MFPSVLDTFVQIDSIQEFNQSSSPQEKATESESRG